MLSPAAQRCISILLDPVHEGGYQCDPHDAGNWTGGKVGAGQLLGTNFGISAASYPDLDIKHLARADAILIYGRDWWPKIHGDELPEALALITLDGAVPSGVRRGVQWMQAGIGAVADGVLGPQTLAAAARCADLAAAVRVASSVRLTFLQSLSGWERYGHGWADRVYDTRAKALELLR